MLSEFDMLLVFAFLIMASQIDDTAPALTPRLTDPSRVMDCMAPLGGETIDRRVEVPCKVDNRGRPKDCFVNAPDLPPKQRTAAICLARAYTVEANDGSNNAGRLVTIPIHLRMNTVPPPPGFKPPGF